MKEEDILVEKCGKTGGFKVPENYFENFASEMMGKLPEYPETKEVPMTLWEKLRPYTYLAAMFMGIWLMMQLFHRVADSSELSLDNPPEQIAQIMQMQSDAVGDMTSVTSFEDCEVEQEVCEIYDNMSEFEEDFGYEFETE